MNWLKVKIFGTNYVNPRGFHNSALIGSELFIFGGYNSNGYVNNEMNVVVSFILFYLFLFFILLNLFYFLKHIHDDFRL